LIHFSKETGFNQLIGYKEKEREKKKEKRAKEGFCT